MAKKKETKAKTTKAKASGASKPVARKGAREPAPVATTTAPDAAAPKDATAAQQPREPDPRLPPPGTVIEKRDRAGKVRCTCAVEENGIRYEGTLYKSLSAAAMAAAKDLGIGGRSQNGYTFFGLSKPPRHAADPIEALARVWERYHARAAAVVAATKDDDRERVRDLFGEHAEALKDLRGRIA